MSGLQIDVERVGKKVFANLPNKKGKIKRYEVKGGGKLSERELYKYIFEMLVKLLGRNNPIIQPGRSSASRSSKGPRAAKPKKRETKEEKELKAELRTRGWTMEDYKQQQRINQIEKDNYSRLLKEKIKEATEVKTLKPREFPEIERKKEEKGVESKVDALRGIVDRGGNMLLDSVENIRDTLRGLEKELKETKEESKKRIIEDEMKKLREALSTRDMEDDDGEPFDPADYEDVIQEFYQQRGSGYKKGVNELYKPLTKKSLRGAGNYKEVRERIPHPSIKKADIEKAFIDAVGKGLLEKKDKGTIYDFFVPLFGLGMKAPLSFKTLVLGKTRMRGAGLDKLKEKKEGMSNEEIDEVMGEHKEYLGTIARDELLGLKPHKGAVSCFIMNTDPKSAAGAHWVAVLIDPNHSIEFYDSFGRPASKAMKEDLKKLVDRLKLKTLLKFKENFVKHQNMKTSNCGPFSIRFLLDRLAGKSFAEASGYKEISVSSSRFHEKQIEKLKKKKFESI